MTFVVHIGIHLQAYVKNKINSFCTSVTQLNEGDVINKINAFLKLL